MLDSAMRKRGRPKHPDILTPREWEVLALLREGFSNDKIAQRLGISLAGAPPDGSEKVSWWRAVLLTATL